MLCENEDDTQNFTHCYAEHTRISENALLQMLATAFDKRERQGQNTPGNEHSILSQCKRFEARFIRKDTNHTRLFVQQKEDYFARLELYVDKQLVAAYQEPVWPHLQKPHPSSGEWLSIPQGCVTLLENAGASRSGYDSAANSDNRDDIQPFDDTAAA